jgi:thioredoxin-related protein
MLPHLTMKRLTFLWILCIAAIGTSTQGAAWLTDLSAAKSQAAREGKNILINFTGSDWCGWCVRLRNEVFSQPEFESYANKNLVLVEIDFPKRKPLAPALQKANVQLANNFKIQGYPTLVFLNQQGSEIHRTGYQQGGVKPFLGVVAKLTGVPHEPTPTRSNPPGKSAITEPPTPLPLFGGAPTLPPPHYNDLILKSISGTKTRRFALLNNQTFALGDAAKVKLRDGEVKVRCIDIRESSVVVALDGEPGQREIKLRTLQ